MPGAGYLARLKGLELAVATISNEWTLQNDYRFSVYLMNRLRNLHGRDALSSCASTSLSRSNFALYDGAFFTTSPKHLPFPPDSLDVTTF